MSAPDGDRDHPPDQIRFTVDEGVGRITIALPAIRNAINLPMLAQLSAALTAAEQAAPRALLIDAEGPAFTVGGDLKYLSESLDDLPAALNEMIAIYHREILVRLAQFEAPVVCAVQGAAAGGGLGIICPCDFVLAAPEAVFATAFSKLGLSGDGGSSWWLPRLVGYRRAQEMIVGGRVLSAEEAAEWGLVSRVVPANELEAEAAKLARTLAQGPTRGLAEMRHLLLRSSERGYGEQLEAELEAMLRTGATEDAVRGVRAFATGESPRFEGH